MSQTSKILSHLKKGKSITQLQALSWYGCLRLSARIDNIKKMGHNVRCVMVETAAGKRVGKYLM